MCGIGGVMLFPSERRDWELEFIRDIVKHIGIENERRGRDAAGVVAFNKDETKLFKAPTKASELLETTTYATFAEKEITNDTHSVLIHTRAATQGHKSNNNNNHPIESSKFIGVHNGVIYNDDELFASENLFRMAEVDSEIIFRLLDKYGDSVEGIVEATEKLGGGFTYAFASKEDRHLLYLVKKSNPVELVYIPELNIIAFASERNFLETAIMMANELFGQDYVDYETLSWITPNSDSIMVFDTTIDTPIDQFYQDAIPFKPHYDYYGGANDGFYHEDYGWVYNRKKKTETKFEAAGEETYKVVMALDYETRTIVNAYLKQEKEAAWNQGWKAGRASLDDEMTIAKGLAYEEGLDKGRAIGYEIAQNDNRFRYQSLV